MRQCGPPKSACNESLLESKHRFRLCCLHRTSQVDQERATSEVLAIQNEHRHSKARAEGEAEAERCLTFLSQVGVGCLEGRSVGVGCSCRRWHRRWHR